MANCGNNQTQIPRLIQMENLESFQFPRGGPIYIEDLVGPLTRVPHFQSSLDEELSSLKAELDSCHEDFDLSVDELRLLSEEELVDMALKQALRDEEGLERDREEGSRENMAATSEKDENVKKRRKGKMSPEKRRKRGRLFDRETRAAQLENPIFIEKVEQLARIKQKQDQDKTAARLHSYNKVNGAIISSSVGRVKSLRSVASSTKVRNSCNALQYTPITHSEVLLSVEVYNQKVKTQELLVPGSQMLSDLRDHIYCSTDDLMQKSGKHDPSGYFLIEELFCNDKRDPFAIDYSKPILEWLRDSKNDAREKWECVLSGELQQKQRALFGESPSPPLPQFKAVEMHRIQFCDISFSLGAGYMYCHQGDCKHLIVIRDMRRIHPEDVQNRASYPVVTFQLKTRFHKCDVCNIYRATKVTVDDKWARENPCHFCDNCYYLLHYGEDGSLLYNDFTVHDYHHG